VRKRRRVGKTEKFVGHFVQVGLTRNVNRKYLASLAPLIMEGVYLVEGNNAQKNAR
jgi:hypothetical protein